MQIRPQPSAGQETPQDYFSLLQAFWLPDQVLERVADAVKEQVGPVLDDALNDQANVLTFNFLANSVLHEVDAQLSAAFPGELHAPNVCIHLQASQSLLATASDPKRAYCHLIRPGYLASQSE